MAEKKDAGRPAAGLADFIKDGYAAGIEATTSLLESTEKNVNYFLTEGLYAQLNLQKAGTKMVTQVAETATKTWEDFYKISSENFKKGIAQAQESLEGSDAVSHLAETASQVEAGCQKAAGQFMDACAQQSEGIVGRAFDSCTKGVSAWTEGMSQLTNMAFSMAMPWKGSEKTRTA